MKDLIVIYFNYHIFLQDNYNLADLQKLLEMKKVIFNILTNN